MEHPPLPEGITVLPDTDIEGAWERFHSSEALHHLHDICNPMSADDLERVIAALGPTDRSHVLDVGCGHGDLLLRIAARTAIHGVGVDLSPWVLLRASARAEATALRGSIEWWLGEGMAVPRRARWDIATCLGASWIWHGFEGTVRALAARLRPGGRLAVGDLRVREPGLTATLPGTREAAALTEAEQTEVLRRQGLEPVDQVVAGDDAWAEYHRLVIESADAFAAGHPEADYRGLAASLMDVYRRDRPHMVWTVWVARTG